MMNMTGVLRQLDLEVQLLLGIAAHQAHLFRMSSMIFLCQKGGRMGTGGRPNQGLLGFYY